MKNFINYISKVSSVLVLSVCVAVSGCYDDSAIQQQLADHESRLKELERITAQQNTNISSLQAIVDALQENDYVTSVTPIMEGENIIGYTINFSNSDSVTIYTSGNTSVPVIGVKQDTDGQWYWTVDGEWITDADGNKIMASGITPKLKIVDGYWYVSYDGGNSWEDEPLGEATGENGCTMFVEVSYDDQYLYITLPDGEVITLPRTGPVDGDDANNTQLGPIRFELPQISGNNVIFNGIITDESAIPYIEEIAVFYDVAGIMFSINSALYDKAVIYLDKTFSISIQGLALDTEYNYCLYVKSRGVENYSDIKSFTTESYDFVENEAWTVEYYEDSELNGETYDQVISVTSSDDNYYFIGVVSEEEYQEYGHEVIILQQYESLIALIQLLNDLGMETSILDFSYNTSAVEPFYLDAGGWRGVAIGVTEEGLLNGLYAYSDLITIVEEEPTEGYSSWLGNWTLTGANGLTQEVTFSQDKVNESYIMTGYEGEEATDLNVIVGWNEEDQSWTINNQIIGYYVFGDMGEGAVWFIGNDNAKGFYPQVDFPICEGGMTEDGKRLAVGYSGAIEGEDGAPIPIDINEMSFIADISGYWYYITSISDYGYPTFPMTITPSETVTKSSSVEKIKDRRIFKPKRIYNTYGRIK